MGAMPDVGEPDLIVPRQCSESGRRRRYPSPLPVEAGRS
jgi:hypothetical protein